MAISLDVIKREPFRFLLLARIFGVMALQSQAVIAGWQIYSLTKSPLLLGITGLVEAIPAIISALYAGHVVDTGKPKKIYLTCLLVLVINTAFLWALGAQETGADKHLIVGGIYIGIFISGLARAFTMPASFSLLPMTVLRNQFPSASAWTSSGFQVAAITGPAVAGLLYGLKGAASAWGLPFLLMVCAFASLFLLKVEEPPRPAAKPPAIENIKAGWAFILKNPALLSVMALDMFAVLFGGAVAMLPAYADQVLHVGAEGLGFLRASPAIGAIITAMYFALKPMQVITARRLLIVVAGFGLCMIGFGLSKIFLLSALFLALSGAFDSVSMIIRGTMMQLLTPEEMRGRISSVNSMFIISSNEIGAFESGLAASLLGLVPSVVAGGCATLLVVAATALISPNFRQLKIITDAKKA